MCPYALNYHKPRRIVTKKAPPDRFRRALGSDDEPPLLHFQQHMASAILLIASLVTFTAEGTIFSVRYSRHLFRVDSEFDQNGLGGVGAFFSEHQIIVMAAPFVAMARNSKLSARIVLEPDRVPGESLYFVILHQPSIVGVEYVVKSRRNGRFFLPFEFGIHALRLINGTEHCPDSAPAQPFLSADAVPFDR